MIKSKSGFTIVELLIVIVVIAILAAISIVAYNGIQQRAKNSQSASAASAYLKGFALYEAANQTYPVTTGFTCLGQTSCRGGTWSSSSSVDTALKTVMATLPTANSSTINDNSSGSVSMGYIPPARNVTLDGVAKHWILYSLEGLTKCPVGKVASGGWPSFSSAAPVSGYTSSNGDSSICFVALPDPSF